MEVTYASIYQKLDELRIYTRYSRLLNLGQRISKGNSMRYRHAMNGDCPELFQLGAILNFTLIPALKE